MTEKELISQVIVSLPDRTRRVLGYAQKIHAEQKRFGDDTQLAHLYRCFLILRDEIGGQDPDMLEAILLHDSIEDQPVTAEDIEHISNATVASLVEELTSPVEKIDDPLFLQKISRSSDKAKLLKLVDRLDNVRSSIPLKAVMPDFVKRYSDVTIEFFLPLAYTLDQQLAKLLQAAVTDATGEADADTRSDP